MDAVNHAFAMSATFFELPREVKEQFPLKKGRNAGFEYYQSTLRLLHYYAFPDALIDEAEITKELLALSDR